MRRFTIDQRRRAMVRRHHLRGDADTPEEVTTALIALHATDPASVYLSVLARSARSTLADVSDAMYERRSLVRWMAMRRTLFVFPTADIPGIQAAISTPLAEVLRRRLISRIRRNGTDPAIEGEPDAWLGEVERRVERSLGTLGQATGAELSARVSALTTTLKPGAPSEQSQNITSPLLTLLGTEGRILRGAPTGPWTSRHHRWEPVDRWWPDGIPKLDPGDSQRALARRWLDRFGPATVEDLRWWTGWNKSTVRGVLNELPIDEVDLHGHAGIALSADTGDGDANDAGPCATLLPALDPTPMGWKDRAWFLDVDPHLVFDRAGNIGPTLWWDGRIIGSWAVAGDGEVRTVMISDEGTDAATAVDAEAARLQQRLDGTVIVPAIRTQLERSLA